jgi:integrase
MRTPYLTLNGRSYVFQRRPRKSLIGGLDLAPLRLTLGPIGIDQARRLSQTLARAADQAFEEAAQRMQTETAWTKEKGQEFLKMVRTLAPAFAGLHVAGQARLPEEIARAATRKAMDALYAIGADGEAGGSLLVARHRQSLVDHYLNVLGDEDAARRELGIPPKPKDGIEARLEQLTAAVEAVQRESAKATEAKSVTPLFSVAAETYIQARFDAKPSGKKEAKAQRAKVAVFLAIAGDKPVDKYRKSDLQSFLNEAVYINPNVTPNAKDPEHLRRQIAINKAKRGEKLTAKTLMDGYFTRVKTILRNGYEEAGLVYPFSGTTFIVPEAAQASEERGSVEPAAFERALRYCVDNGFHEEALMLALGRLTGRRQSALTFLQFEWFKFEKGQWGIIPKSEVTYGGRILRVPIKTEESLTFFPLHKALVETGLIDWAKGRTGPLFRTLLHRAQNPDNAMQKRLDRVLEAASALPAETVKGKYGPGTTREVRPKEFTFHDLRHSKIDELRELAVDGRIARLQVGHALLDEHEKYGELQPKEAELLVNLPLPNGIDWSLLKRIDLSRINPRPRN